MVFPFPLFQMDWFAWAAMDFAWLAEPCAVALMVAASAAESDVAALVGSVVAAQAAQPDVVAKAALSFVVEPVVAAWVVQTDVVAKAALSFVVEPVAALVEPAFAAVVMAAV